MRLYLLLSIFISCFFFSFYSPRDPEPCVIYFDGQHFVIITEHHTFFTEYLIHDPNCDCEVWQLISD